MTTTEFIVPGLIGTCVLTVISGFLQWKSVRAAPPLPEIKNEGAFATITYDEDTAKRERRSRNYSTASILFAVLASIVSTWTAIMSL